MSQTHPLEIAVVSGETFSGALGVTLAPGKWDPGSASGGWARDLATDLDAIAAWRARVVVTLIEPHEFDLLRIPSLSGEVRRRGMDWLHLPIRDVSVPDAAFEAAWPEHSAALHNRLAAGENVESLGLTGEEVYDFPGLTALLKDRLAAGRTLRVKATASDGKAKEFDTMVRIDTPQEIEYYEHGGILQYVLRQLAAK